MDKTRTVFLSSTTRDLAGYRDAAYQAISELKGFQCVRMEDFGARAPAASTLCEEKVTECDLFVGVVGPCYGSTPPDSELSFTEMEYEAAMLHGKPCLMFLTSEDFPLPGNLRESDDLWRRQQAFRRRVEAEHVRDRFTSPTNLAEEIIYAIQNWQKESIEADLRVTRWRNIRVQYLENIVKYFEYWSERYTDLRLTTDIRVASYKGYRIKTPNENEKWWFREALDLRDPEGRLLYEEVVILGDPGGGKTTACQRAVWEIARAGLGAHGAHSDELVPLYLELGGYRADNPQLRSLAPYQRILTLLAQEMTRHFASADIPLRITGSQLEDYMRLSRFSFFLDGLNEVGLNHRESLVGDIISFANTFRGRGHQLILTTRKMDYEYDLTPLLPMERFKPLEILELDSSGVNEFVMRDLGQITSAYQLVESLPTNERKKAIASLDALKTDLGVNDVNHLSAIKRSLSRISDKMGGIYEAVLSSLVSAQQLLALLRQPDHARVLWLAQNPATLKDIVDVYRSDKTLPKSRVRLFERAIQVRLYAQVAKLGEQRSHYSEELKLDALQNIALQMMRPGEGLRLSRRQVLDAFIVALRNLDHDVSEADLLLHELMFKDSLLAEPAYGQYSFIKQPYQEYFAARDICAQWKRLIADGRDPLTDQRLGPILRDRRYYQVSSTMAGLLTSEDAHTLVNRLRRHKSTRRLAALCVRQAEDLPHEAVRQFIVWTRRHILRFAFLPEEITNVLLVLATLVIYALFWNADLRTLSSQVATIVSASISAETNATLRLALGVILALMPLVLWGLLRREYRRGNMTRIWANLDIGATLLALSYPILSFFNNEGTNLGTLFGLLSAAGLLALLVRSAAALITPLSGYLNTRIEEYIVNRHLITFLEIMREMGPDASSTIIEIQEEVADNQFMSLRIKDAIQRTWTLSPRTVLQAIEDVKASRRQAEAVRILEPVVLREDIENTLREQAAAALLSILSTESNEGAVLAAIQSLGRIASEQVAYRNRISDALRLIVSEEHYSLNTRRRAWRILQELGITNINWPQSNWRQSLRLGLLISGILLGIIILIVILQSIR